MASPSPQVASLSPVQHSERFVQQVPVPNPTPVALAVEINQLSDHNVLSIVDPKKNIIKAPSGKKKSSSFHWSDDNVSSLIHLRTDPETNARFRSACKSKHAHKLRKEWELLFERFIQKCDSDNECLDLSLGQLQEKWKGLCRTFQTNLEKAGKNGEATVRWKFFKLMKDSLQPEDDHVSRDVTDVNGNPLGFPTSADALCSATSGVHNMDTDGTRRSLKRSRVSGDLSEESDSQPCKRKTQQTASANERSLMLITLLQKMNEFTSIFNEYGSLTSRSLQQNSIEMSTMVSTAQRLEAKLDLILQKLS